MTEIPTWLVYTWVIFSALFFLVNLIFYAVLIMVVLKLRPALEGMTEKINELTVKVEGVANRVEEVAKNVGETVGNVGKKATGIMGSVELIAQSASRQFERFSPFLVGAMTAMRLVKALNEMRSGKSVAEATKEKTLEKKPASSPPAKRKFLGLF